MAELSLKQIADKLNSEFTGDTRKLVFWYDPNGDFKEDIDTLELANARLLKAGENNQFYIKYFLEIEDKTTNYLVYAPFEKPDIHTNHLVDTIKYSKEFFADRISLVMVDLGINEKYRYIIKKYEKFFASKERTQRFCDLELELFNEQTIETALMAVLCKCKSVSFEDILRCVLSDDFDGNKCLEEFEKYDLTEAFWNYVEQYFGYRETNPSVEKLTISLFITYAMKHITADVPKAWSSFITHKSGTVIAFLDNLMNNVIYRDKFDELSAKIYKSSNAEAVLADMPAEDVINCAVFKEIDNKIIDWIIARLDAEDVGARLDGISIPEICRMRSKKHFCSGDKTEYSVLENAFEIISNSVYNESADINSLITKYTKELYKTDTCYRNFYFCYDSLENAEKYEDLRQKVENIYTTEYLAKITTNWNNLMKASGGNTTLSKQIDFYAKNIKNADSRTVVIISDALRYEVAAELYEKFTQDEKCTAKISAVQGVLPSYTPLGMASLLPHSSIEYSEDYTVLVDGKPCATTAQRQEILQQYKSNSRCVQFEDVRNMKKDELRAVFQGMDTVYVYHNQIDARGDAAKTENEVFVACCEAVDEIHSFIRRIASQANSTHFIVTADHGFIYKRDKLSENDKIITQVAKLPIGKRYAISTAPVNEIGVESVSLGQVLGNGDKRFVSYPLGPDIFKTPGSGMNFVHGGSSPQEMLVPVITVSVDKYKVETVNATIALITPITKLTNLITFLDFLQSDPVSDVVKATNYKVYFIDANGDKISNEIIYNADSKEADPTKRITRFKFRLKNQKYSNVSKYYVVACDESTGVELFRHETTIDIAFADDFGFGL